MNTASDSEIVYRHIERYGGQITRAFQNPSYFLVLLGTPNDKQKLWQEFRGADCLSQAANFIRRYGGV